jgi:hypothetical protein
MFQHNRTKRSQHTFSVERTTSVKKMRGFIRTKEDFVCEQCGMRVTGNGYTNHCPSCLWSKHVDENPGDRSSPCGGSMEPVSVSVHRDAYRIFHQCALCGFIRAQDAAREDNMERLVELSGRPFKEFFK